MPRVIVTLVLLLQVVALGCVTHLREAPWIIVKSARFEVFSTLTAGETKALATELERFHALVYAVTNAPKVESAVPTRIYALARRSQYSQLGPVGSAGFFKPGLRYNMIVLADYSPMLGASEVILHEYVHLVLRNGKNRPYPIWYDEGMAEFFSTVVRHENALAIGAIPKARISALERLDWVPIERIIAARSYDDLPEDDRGMLYPESWALVHYLALDREPGSLAADARTVPLSRAPRSRIADRRRLSHCVRRAARKIEPEDQGPARWWGHAGDRNSDREARL